MLTRVALLLLAAQEAKQASKNAVDDLVLKKLPGQPS